MKFRERVYEAVRRIPYGKVATYQQIAYLAGSPNAQRAVGNALHKNPDPDGTPCFRVVNAEGKLTGAFAFGGIHVQEAHLKKEGVEVVNLQVDLRRFQWRSTERDRVDPEKDGGAGENVQGPVLPSAYDVEQFLQAEEWK